MFKRFKIALVGFALLLSGWMMLLPEIHVRRQSAAATTCHVPASGITQGRCAPYFFVIGVFKGGTTSLYNYLGQHPGVKLKFINDTNTNTNTNTNTPTHARSVRLKETNFFTAWNVSSRYTLGMARTVSEYMNLFFPPIYPSDHLMTGEASPSYIYTPDVADKLYKTFPHARLIAMLREPVERAFSRVAHAAELRCDRDRDLRGSASAPYCQTDGLRAAFDQIIRLEIDGVRACLQHVGLHPDTSTAEIYARWNAGVQCFTESNKRAMQKVQSDDVRAIVFIRYCLGMKTISHGLYVLQLRYWLRLFPWDQLMVIRSEDFYAHTAQVMNDVTRHVHLKPLDWSSIVQDKYNVGVDQKRRSVGFVKSKGGENQHHNITLATRQLLQEFFQPFNDALTKLLQRDCKMW